MAKNEGKKGGKRKRYGPKMSNPRIATSKEHRQCGPLGYKARANANGGYFSTRAAALNGSH